MAASGVNNLIFIDGIMDTNMYLNILKENLLQSAENLRKSLSFNKHVNIPC